ncbi:PhoH family protein [Gloeobacter kilaueensis]|uniref:PhoH-like protein n=1 Tax=Gloeobacter kilaueensis (strain ATCC BAA-2537 / CCAP 1431/1 / ULC 316 / JS1) TaxID=1183438 RepID=U5QH88_GLOK1|nr:PhoH family protein [Gloeobacter kilaueensis]AGY58307.1 PhoH family protein [Gloeobacter kilaueensis JS1]
MSDNLTIHLPDISSTLNLAGPAEENLRELEARTGAQLVLRGQDLLIAGTDEQVQMSQQIIQNLENLWQRGRRIANVDLSSAYQAVSTGQTEELRRLQRTVIAVNRRGESLYTRTLGQWRYIQAIQKHDLTFGIGPAGTGKTYLAAVQAVLALQEKRVERIILTRPAVEAGERLGYLPGDLQAKVSPYLRPLYDALYEFVESERLMQLMDRGTVEVAPLAYMRGRTLANAFVILDEAQNTTGEQMKMMLTRLGNASKMVVTGDITQTDLPAGTRSGLQLARRILSGVRGIAFCEFNREDVVRHPLVQRIIEAYEHYEAVQKPD